MFQSYFSKKFAKQYSKLPLATRNKFDRQIQFLLKNLRHPSIHAKKKQGAENIWEGRVDRFYRFTFSISEDIITLRAIGPHDEALG